ncbi:HEAT repeat domain-containing protein [Candidatus Pyrohabitans sp.]
MYDWLDKLLQEDEKERKEVSFPAGRRLEGYFKTMKDLKRFIEKSKFTGMVRAKSRIENLYLLYLHGELAGVAASSRLGLYNAFGERALRNILDPSLIIESIEEYTYEELYSTLTANPELITSENLRSEISRVKELLDILPPATLGLLEMLAFSEVPLKKELLKIVGLSVFLLEFEENFEASFSTVEKLDFVNVHNGEYEIAPEYRAMLQQLFILRAKVGKAGKLLRSDDATRDLCALLSGPGKGSYGEFKKLIGGDVDAAICKLVSLGVVFRGVDASGLPTIFLPKVLSEQLRGDMVKEEKDGELSREELMERLNIRDPTDKDIESLVRSMLEDSEDELQALDPLIDALREGDARVRSVAASALAKIGDERAVGPVVNALFDEDSRVRASAAKALGTLKSIKAVKPLIASLSDRDSAVRASAARALGSIGDTRAIEPLIASLSDRDSTVRASVARALGSIGDTRAIEPLMASFYSEGDEFVRRDILLAISGYRDNRILEMMTQCLHDRDAYVRRIAASALWKNGGKGAIEPLIKALGDEESTIRYCAVSALDGITDECVIEPLINALEDEDEMVRTVAASALGKIEDARAVEALRKALNDKSEWVRNCAVEALQNLGFSVSDPDSGNMSQEKAI